MSTRFSNIPYLLQPKKMTIRVDFHSHTFASKDSISSPESMIAACKRKKIDRLVITDHNTIRGALVVKSMDPDLIIIGEEIMTTRGELLAAYVQEEIPAGLSPLQAINRLREQGAFISVSHPFDSSRNGSWKSEDLSEILPLVDAIEVFNARCVLSHSNHLAKKLSEKWAIAGTAGSDAHGAFEVGGGFVELSAFYGAVELKKVLPHGKIYGKRAPFWVHFVSRYARIAKKYKV